MAEYLLEEQKDVKEYIEIYEEIRAYFRSHDVEAWETEYFRNSGAAELLMTITQEYRRGKRK